MSGGEYDGPEFAAGAEGDGEPGGRRPSLRAVGPEEQASGQWAVSPKGQLLKSVGNAFLKLASSPMWALWYDEESELAHVARAPVAAGKPARVGELDDYVVETAQQWIGWAHLDVSVDVARKALVRLARQDCRRPVEEYLRGVTWDGVRRLATMAATHLGACGSEADVARSCALTRLWMLSAVARAMRPGCQADYMLILVGPQGARKTSAFTVLAGKWLQPSLPQLSSMDASLALLGSWVVCLDELSAFKHASTAESAKDFLTRRTDRYRPPYGASLVRRPRRCVFAGTTNDDSFLTDSTGSRRFWCVRTVATDTDALERDRDQLWAEAVAEYLDGAEWWPTKELERSSQEANEHFEAHDEWEATIAEWCANRSSVTIKFLLTKLGFADEKDHGQREQKRVATVLKSTGWKRVRRGGRGAREYVYVRGDAE